MFGFKALSINKIVSAVVVATRNYSSNLILNLTGDSLYNRSANAVILDRSVNAAAVTRAGDAAQQVSSFSPFSSGSSYYFDGTGDYISAPANTALQLGTGDFTVECWVYATTAPSDVGIFENRDGSVGSTNGFTLTAFSSSVIRIYSGSILISSSGTSYVNTWCHVAVVRQSGTLKLYINGVSQGTSSASLNMTNSDAIIGAGRYAGNSTPNACFPGYISNFRIVKGTAVYTGNFTPSTSALTNVVNTSLLTCHAPRLFDGSVNNLDLTAFGNTSASTFSPFDKTALSGSVGSTSVSFDGNGDYLSVPTSTGFDFGTGDFTVECWAYRTGAGTGDRFLVSRGNGANFLLRWNASGVLQFWLNSTLINSYTYSFPINNWVHVAVAREGSTCRMFVNGVEVSSAANTTNVSSTAAAVLIGGFTSSDFFQGYISNVRIVKGTAVYSTSFTPSSSALTAVSGTSLLTLQDGSFKDNSSSALAITRNGDVLPYGISPFGGGGSNWSVYFDGTGDNLSLPSSANLEMGSGNFTWEFWLYRSADVASQHLLGQQAAGFTIQFDSPSSSQLIVYDGATRIIGNITLNTWTHFALVRSGSTLQGYINGVATGSSWSNSSSTVFTLSGGIIGSRWGATNGYNGYISNLRIVKGTALYTSKFTPSTSPLTAIAGTSLLALQSSTFTDNSSNAFTITKAGDAEIRRVGPFGAPNVWSTYFDGTGDYLTLPAASLDFMHQGAESWTFETWVYPSVAANQAVISTTGSSAQTGFLAYITSTGQAQLFIYRGSSGNSYSCTTGAGALVAGAWQHLAITFDSVSKAISIFINGIQQAVTTTGTASFSASTATYAPDIGRFMTASVGAGGYFTGYMSNLRVVRGYILYGSNFTPSTSALTAVNGTSLLTLQDSSFKDNSSSALVVSRAGDVQPYAISPFGGGSNWSGYFDGTGDYLKVASNSAFDFGSGDLTIEAWIYPTSFGSGADIISQPQNNANAADGLSLYCSNTGVLGLYAAASTGGYAVTSITTAISLNSWYHVAGTRNGNTWTLWVNGKSVGTATWAGTITQGSGNYGGIQIGSTISAGAQAFFFTGHISNVRIVKGTALYTTNFTPSTSSLIAVAGTSLLTLQGSTFTDNSSNAFAITRVGNTEIRRAGPFGAPNVWSGYFDGNGDYLTLPNNAAHSFGSTPFTVEGWFYSQNLTGPKGIVGNFRLGSSNGWRLVTSGSTTVQYYQSNGATADWTGQLALNTWYHFAIVGDGTTIKVYINGVAGSTTCSQSASITSGGVFSIGKNSDDSGGVTWPFTGYISNVRIVKGTALYTSAFTPSTSPLTAISGTSLLTLQSSTLTDNSTSALAITKFGDAAVREISPFNQPTVWSAYFDGTGDTISWAGTTLSADFTIECWFYQTAKSAQYVPVISGTTGTYNFPLILDYTGTGRVGFYLTDTTAGNSGASTFNLNTWNHVALTRSGNSLRLFLNGSQVATGTSSASVLLNTIGGWTGSVGYLIFGYISNVRIVNGTALYTSAFTPSTSPLTAVADTSLLTLQDRFFKDNSTNAFTLTRAGDTVTWPGGPFTEAGVWSSYFDGTDYLTLPANSLNFMHQGTASWTFETWLYSTSSAAQTILATTATSAQTGIAIDINGSGAGMVSAYIYRSSAGNWWGISSRTGAVVPNTWYHLAITFDGSSKAFTLFINGVPQPVTVAGTVGFNAGNASYAPQIGRYFIGSAGSYFIGYMSNMRVVQGSILYSSAFIPSTSALSAVNGTTVLTLQNNAFRDNSSNAYAITKSGDTVVKEVSPFNQPIFWRGTFDGTGDYLTVPANSAFQFGTGDFTVEAWIYPTTVTGTYTSMIVGTYAYVAGDYGWGLGLSTTGKLMFWSNGASGTGMSITESGTRVVNQWCHVAVSRSGTSVKLWVNGVEAASTTSSKDENYSRILKIGSQEATNLSPTIGNSGTTFKGSISNLRIVKGSAVYTSTFTPPTSPLTADTNTSLLTLQSNTFRDNSNNNFTITAAGDAAMQPGGPFTEVGTWSSYFDGVGDYLALPSASIDFMHQGTASWTFDAWIYSTSTVAQAMLSTTSASAQTGIYIAINNSAAGDVTVTFSRSSAGNQYIGRSPTGKIVPNTWNHVAVTYNGTSKAISIFINGAPQPVTITGTATFSASTASNAPSIGRDFSSGAAGGYFIGYMSNMRIVQGSVLYTSAFTPSTSALTAVSGTSLLTCDGAAITDSSSTNAAVTAGGDARVAGVSPFNNAGGWSGYFDGTGDYLSIPSNAAFAFGTGDFTVEMWFNTSNATTRQDPLSAYTSTTGFGFALSYDNAGDVLFYSGDTLLINTSGSQWSANVWNHLAVSRSGTTLRMFLNGSQIASVTNSTNFTVASSLYLGIAGNVSLPYIGYLSNVRIVKGTALYTTAFTPSTSTLTAVSGTSLLTLQDSAFKDNSSNAFALTPAGDVSMRGVGPFAEPNVWSGFFDGTGDKLTIADNAAFQLGTSNFTIEFWVNFSSFVDGKAVLTKGWGTVSAPFLFYTDGVNNRFRFYASSNGSSWDIANAVSIITSPVLNTWYHCAVVRNGSTFKIYLNGAEVTTFTSSAALNAASGQPVTIGSSVGDAAFNGYVSNVRIVKGTALYTSAFTPSTSPLTAVAGTSLLTLQDNSFRDNSSNNFAITRSGDVIMRPNGPLAASYPSSTALFPGSVYFDGANDYLTIPASAALNVFGGDFTIECWFNPVSFNANSYNYLIFQDDGVNASQNFQLKCSSTGIISFVAFTTTSRSSAFTQNSAKALKLGTWNHIAVTHVKSSNTTRLFLNGALESTATNAIWAGAAVQTCLGNYSGTAIQGTTYSKLNGYMSGVRLVKGTALYTSAFVPPAAPPIATANTALLLNFNDGGIVDKYGSSSAGVVRVFGDASTNTVTKKYGTASAYFDGTGDYLITASDAAYVLGTGDFTIEGWIYQTATSVGSYRTIMANETAGNATGNWVMYSYNNQINIWKGTGVSSSAELFTPVGSISLNSWVHIAWTRSGGSNRIFINGTQVGNTVSDSFNLSGSQVYIGSNRAATQFFAGYMDDIRIYKGYAKYTTAFTPSQD